MEPPQEIKIAPKRSLLIKIKWLCIIKRWILIKLMKVRAKTKKSFRKARSNLSFNSKNTNFCPSLWSKSTGKTSKAKRCSNLNSIILPLIKQKHLKMITMAAPARWNSKNNPFHQKIKPKSSKIINRYRNVRISNSFALNLMKFLKIMNFLSN